MPANQLLNSPSYCGRYLIAVASLLLPTAWSLGGIEATRTATLALLTVGLAALATAAIRRALSKYVSLGSDDQMAQESASAMKSAAQWEIASPMLHMVLGSALRMLLMLFVLAIAMERAPVSLAEADRTVFAASFSLFYLAMLIGEVRSLLAVCGQSPASTLSRMKTAT